MHRRRFLGGLSAAALGGLAGCVAGLGGGIDRSTWESDHIGYVTTVSDGLVIGREDPAAHDGGIFALDQETGELAWSFGESWGLSSYAKPVVSDAVYTAIRGDVVASDAGEFHAINLDGSERWTQPIGSVFSRPIPTENGVYVVANDGIVRRLDPSEGTATWETPVAEEPMSVELIAVTNTVYVRSDRIHAIDPADGDVRWTHEPEVDLRSGAHFTDDTIVVRDDEGFAAISDGDERWRVDYDELGQGDWHGYAVPRVRAVTPDRVLGRVGNRLHGLDEATGEEQWSIQLGGRQRIDVTGDIVYAVGSEEHDATLHALGLHDGEQRWERDFELAALDHAITVADDHLGDSHDIFVTDRRSKLARFAPDGERTWEWTLPEGGIGTAVVDEFVYVGTDSGVRALDPR